ncbi:MAG: PilZ domain-containing protein [Clostridia bacterium]|nr:PilZ domain-containing protein [Clostridia bacterium]
MPDNKITIGIGKKNKDDKTQRTHKDDFNNTPIAPVESDQKPEQNYYDEQVWGNDSLLAKKLDEQYLAEKRMFVRVRYIQHIECKKISNNVYDEPITLNKPMLITLSDISMAGMGAVCSHELGVGSVLEFDMQLDHLQYTIKCQVIYSIFMEDSYRIGLKIATKDKDFIKHLKIVVARISLNAKYNNDPGK